MPKFDKDTISRYVKSLKEKSVTPNEIKRKLQSINRFIKWAVTTGQLDQNDFKQMTQEIANTVISPTESEGRLKSVKISSNKNELASTDLSRFQLISTDNPIQGYIGFAVIFLLISLIGFGLYNQFFKKTATPFAYSTTLNPGSRIISFQGRLTDSLGNPIIAPIDLTYNFYTVSTGGSPIASSTRVCTATPDQDGIFANLIGSDPGPSCTPQLPATIFSENPNVWLGVTVGSELTEMSPRQQIANVGYAMNAETLQGFPPGTTTSSIPFISTQGDLLIAATTPGIRSTYTTANFVISSAKTTTIQSANAGDIVLSATDGGALRFNTFNGSLVERLTVLSGGNVGISNVNPRAAFDVIGSASISANLAFSGASTQIGQLNGGNISFTTSPGGDAGLVTKMTFTNPGNLGIGTTAPSEKLDITGNASLSGNLTIGQGSVLRSQYGPLSLAYKSGLGTWTTGITLQDTTGNVGVGSSNPNAFKLEVVGNIGPDANGTRDIGSSARHYANIYADNITGVGALGYWSRGTGVLFPATVTDGVSATTSATTTATFTATGSNNALRVGGNTNYHTVDVNGNLTFTNAGIATITGPTSGLTIDATTGALNFGTSANARTITIGNITTTTGVNVNTGTAGTTYTTTNGIFTLNTGTGAISLGTDAAAKTVTIGNVTSTTGVNINTGTAGTTHTTTNGIYTLNTGTGTISLGTDAVAKTINIGNATTTTGLALNSGTGDIVLTSTDQIKLNSSKAAGGTTTEALSLKSTIDLGVADELLQIGDSGADFMTILGNGNVGIGTALPSSLLHLSSTSTSTSFTGFNLDWSPGSATTTTGDLFALNIGTNGTASTLFNVKDTGSSLFSVSETAVTSNLPTSFTSAGDVSIAYDLLFTNPTSSYIKSAAPLYIQAGEVFGSSDLTLKTYNSGDVVLDAAGGVTLAQAQPWTLVASTTALNIQSGLLNLDTTNTRVGIGSTAPTEILDVVGNASASGYITLGQTGALRSQYGPLNLAYKSGLNTWATGFILKDVSGNVGIGTTDPATFKLEVAGNIGPDADNTRNIGAVGRAYNTIYVNNIVGSGGLGYWSRGTGVLFPTTTTDGLAATTSATTVATFTATGSNNALRVGGITNYATIDASGNLTFTNAGVATITGPTTGLTIDATTGAMNFGTSANARTITIGNATTTTALALNSGTGDIVLTSTDQVKLNSSKAAGGTTTEALSLKSTVDLGVADELLQIGDSGADFMTILGNGNVGIGQVLPIEKLDIVGNASSSGYITLGQTGALRSQYGPLNLAYKSALNAWTTGLTLQDTTGNVGIGATNPGKVLDIQRSVTGADVGLRIANTAATTNDTASLYFQMTSNMAADYGAYIRATRLGANAMSDLSFATTNSGGTSNEWIRITNAGNVGIGSTSPTAKLDIAGDASTSGDLSFTGATPNNIHALNGTDFRISTSPGGDAGNVDRFTLLANGNVGIGTTSPGNLLRIADATAGNPNQLSLYNSLGAAAMQLTGGTGYTILKTNFNGAGQIDTNGAFYISQSFTTTPLYIESATASNTLYLRSTGNVGIGTTVPRGKLDVQPTNTNGANISNYFGGSAAYSLTLNGNQDNNAKSTIFANAYSLYNTGGEATYKWVTTHGSFGSRGIGFSYGGAGKGIQFYADSVATTADTTFTPTSRMMIQNDGNVGIGTTSPTALLDVRGNATFSGTLSIAPMFIAAAGTCNISSTGKIYYDATLNQYYFCNGTIWTAMGGGVSSLQGAYDGGNTITTTTARDIDFTLAAGLGTATSLKLTNNHVGATTAFNLVNANASGTNTNGILVNQTGAGALTNGINITQTAGTLTNGLTLAGTFTKLINSTNFNVANAGNITVTGGQGLDTIAAGTLALGDTTANAINMGTSALARTIIVGNSTGATSIALNTGTGSSLNLGTNAIAHTVTLGNATGATAVAINSGTGDITLASTDQVILNSSKAAGGTTTEALSLKSTANLGAADEVLQIGDSGGDFLTIMGDGNVGIGTTGPAQMLDVAGSANIGDAVGEYLQIGKNAYSTVPATEISPALYLYRESQVSYGIKLQYTGGEYGPMIFGPNQANRFISFGKISSAGAPAGDADFGTEYMRIDLDNGNVGIGTTSPLEKLDITGNASMSGNLTIGQTGVLRSQYGPLNLAYKSGLNAWTTGITLQDTTGNVGIGTTNPANKLDVSGGNINIGASASYRINNKEAVRDMTTYLAVGLDFGTVVFPGTGNVGIGSTAPTAKLDILGSLNVQGYATASASLSIGSYNAMGGVGNALFSGNVGIGTTNATSRFFVNLGANQLARFNDGTNASGATFQNGSILSQSSQFQIAATSTNPLSFYTGATINSMTPGTERIRVATTGNVGIGGALNTNAQLDLNGGTILAGQYCPTSTCQRYIVPNGTSRIDLLQVASDLPNNTGYISFLDANNSYVPIASISAQATGTVVIDNTATNITDVGYPTVPDLCIGDPFWCTGKIDAGTVDPPYTINGKKYATFLTAMTGVKEETTGTIVTNFQDTNSNFQTNSNNQITKGYAVKVIDFNAVPEASDLWLFSKTTNLRKNLGKMTVLLTPSDDTRTWYKVDNTTHSLTIYSSRPTTISYRLTAPRFDGERWTNENPGGSGGFELNDPDQPSLVALNQAGNVPPETFTISSVIAKDASVMASNTSVIPNESFVILNSFQDLNQMLKQVQHDMQKSYNVISNKTGDFIEEVGVFAQITVGQIKAGFIETENAIVNNILLAKNVIVQEKIISPVVETKEIKTQGGDLVVSLRGASEASDAAISANEIASSSTTGVGTPRNDSAGSLAKLIIKGLNDQTVASIDAAGNATFAGTLSTLSNLSTLGNLSVAKDATISGSLTANEASLSGTLVAKEVHSENIDQLNNQQGVILNSFQDLNQMLKQVQHDSTSSAQQLSTDINAVQAQLAQIKNSPLPDPNYYQNLSSSVIASGSEAISQQIATSPTAPRNDIFETLTVSGNSNLYNASIANSLTAGNIFIQNNEILSLSWELKLSALAQITLFDGSVTIAKNGNITTEGQVIAKGGVRTDTIQPINNDVNIKLNDVGVDPRVDPTNTGGHVGPPLQNGKINIQNQIGDTVASIDASGSAKFNALGFNQIATNSAIIADSGLRTTSNEIIPAMQTNAEAAGQGILPLGAPEVIIYNDKITKDSLVYLTKTNSVISDQLSVMRKESCPDFNRSQPISTDLSCHPYFSVSSGNSQHGEIRFNWLIIN
ncbi:hypothetical protein HZC27_00395 [Candidatus Roizmanbacteria bacterium]|nr:hypothetical protein [Candidatus Roizmanbacteria bacterium]